MEEGLKKMLRQLEDLHAKMMAEHIPVNYPVLKKKIALEWSGKKVKNVRLERPNTRRITAIATTR